MNEPKSKKKEPISLSLIKKKKEIKKEKRAHRIGTSILYIMELRKGF